MERKTLILWSTGYAGKLHESNNFTPEKQFKSFHDQPEADLLTLEQNVLLSTRATEQNFKGGGKKP